MTEAEEVLEQFRERLLGPYLSVREDLQAIGDSVAPGSSVSGRPKRFDRIIEKLIRQPRLRLSQMQDVGGCRLVLPQASPGADTLHALYAVAARVRDRWSVRTEDDYVATPRASGYRALHLIVDQDEEQVEIQIRTYRQDLWAQLVEANNRSSGSRLDLEEGPETLRRALVAASNTYAALDRGESMEEIVRDEGLQALLILLFEIFRRD